MLVEAASPTKLSAPRHVLMTVDTVGGVWTYSLTLARSLARHGVLVSLATMGAPLSRQQRREAAALPNVTLYESTYKLEWMDDPWQDVVQAGEWLLGLAGRVRPDIVHLNGYVHAALPWQQPVLVVGHSCVLSWWEAVHGEVAPAEWETYREAVWRGLLAADCVVAPTRAMALALERLYRLPKPCHVVPNGVSQRTTEALLQKEPLVFSAGRLWDEAKNIRVVCEAAAGLPWPVYVAGDTTHPDHGGTIPCPQAHLLGRLPSEDLAAWMQRASIYVFPALYEPFGLSILEAAQAGCALVLSDIDSLRELWDGAAQFVTPQDTQAVHTALAGLIDDEPQRTALGQLAQQRALAYSEQACAESYLRLYSGLLTGKHGYPLPGPATAIAS